MKDMKSWFRLLYSEVTDNKWITPTQKIEFIIYYNSKCITP